MVSNIANVKNAGHVGRWEEIFFGEPGNIRWQTTQSFFQMDARTLNRSPILIVEFSIVSYFNISVLDLPIGIVKCAKNCHQVGVFALMDLSKTCF